jgi:LacI family transcriptional regulator
MTTKTTHDVDPHDDHMAALAERPTLKTIALATGLAVATVSRALKDAPDIGETTKKRVRAMALQLGYRPNRAGVRLRTGKTNVIALVLSTESDVMNNTAKLIYSIADSLRGTPYHLVVMPFFSDQNPLDPVRYLVETGSADGIIMNQTQPNDPRIAYLTEHRIPFATHGRTDMGIDHPYFDYDSYMFGVLAARKAAMLGRKFMYLIAPPQTQMYARHTIDGVIAECKVQGIQFELAQNITSDSTAGAIETAVFDRVGQADRPDILMSVSTTGAMAAVAGAEARGLKIGQDFDIISKEAIEFLHRFRKDIVLAHENVGQAGAFLAQATIAAIQGLPPQTGLQVPDINDFHAGQERE